MSLVVGVAAEFAVIGHTPADIAWLVRVAIMLPTILFLGWWFVELGHVGTATDMPAVLPAHAPVADAEIFERMEAMEQVFDAAAVPAARRGVAGRTDQGAEYRRSLRSPEHVDRDVTRQAYGLSSPERPPLDRAAE